MDNFLKENVRELAELKMSVQFSQSELHDLKESIKRDTVLHKDYDRIIEQMSADVKKMDDTTDYLENQSRRNNLRIDGVKERGGDMWEMTEEALRRTFENDLKMPTEQERSLAIERAHRTGGKADRDRTIVVKFVSFKAIGCRSPGCEICKASGRVHKRELLDACREQEKRATS